MYRLYRPETQYHNGKHVRDLSKLNRDLSQVCRVLGWSSQPLCTCIMCTPMRQPEQPCMPVPGPVWDAQHCLS
jgi:hypothetical protein